MIRSFEAETLHWESSILRRDLTGTGWLFLKIFGQKMTKNQFFQNEKLIKNVKMTRQKSRVRSTCVNMSIISHIAKSVISHSDNSANDPSKLDNAADVIINDHRIDDLKIVKYPS